jgi:hypothetical protein
MKILNRRMICSIRDSKKNQSKEKGCSPIIRHANVNGSVIVKSLSQELFRLN